MAGGKAIRRRQKLVEKSNQGNLHKSARRKAGASAHLPLPGAPTQKDYQEKLPASLRKMLALKEVAQQPSKRPKLLAATAQQPLHSPRHQAAAKEPAARSTAEDQPGAVQEAGSPGVPAKPAGKQQQHTAQLQQQSQQQPQPQRQQQQQEPQPCNKGLIWEQPKKLKPRKKAYLNAKKLKKKKARAGGQRDPDDALAAAAAAAAQPAFGEVVHAPPEVQLKRKHWDSAAADKAAQQQQQQQQQRTKQQKQKQKPTTQQEFELSGLRDRAIAGYRAGRPAPREGHATLQSLKALVTK